jgi:hypothetical protein
MKPWMTRRQGESLAVWMARLNKTCFRCGKEFPSVKQTNDHEGKCHG